MLSRLVITFLPRSKRVFISWLQSPSAVILEPQKESSTVSPSIFHEVMELDTCLGGQYWGTVLSLSETCCPSIPVLLNWGSFAPPP